MSGHSKWATTKRAKAVTDAKRSASFTRVAHAITIAARDKGGDPEINFSLRLAIDKAREANMPKENIERAIKRGTGELEGTVLEEITYEGYGPGGVAVIVQTLTDNRNRTVSDVKHVFTKQGGNLGSAGSVAWIFEKKGTIGIEPERVSDDLELSLIEHGAQDVIRDAEGVTVITAPEDLQGVRTFLEEQKIPLVFAEFDWIAKNKTVVDDETRTRLEKLFDALESLDDVTDYYSNMS